ncbi:MAG: phage holin family protein [Rubrivivax sp.]|nr:phage holin family protein [Rubrivivax sp.]
MIHPLLRKLVTQPELFVEHADCYGELASVETRLALRSLRRSAALALLALACAICGLGLGGTAVMFAAAVPLEQMPAPSLLLAVPLVVFAAAAACGWLAWRAAEQPLFAHLREQWQADRQFLRELGHAAHSH